MSVRLFDRLVKTAGAPARARTLACLVTILGAVALARPGAAAADDVLDEQPEESSSAATKSRALTRDLPEIEARSFEAKVVRAATSEKVYVLEDASGELASPGQLLLLKKGAENVMALRVLRNYPERNQLAARVVKRYGDFTSLPTGELFRALEKKNDLVKIGSGDSVSDLAEVEEPGGASRNSGRRPASAEPAAEPEAPPPPPADDLSESEPIPAEAEPTRTAAAPAASLKELEMEEDSAPAPAAKAAAARDEDGPHPRKAAAKSAHREAEDSSPLYVEETFPVDPYRNWLTAGFGLFRNSAGGAVSYFSGVGLRYGFTLGRMIIARGVSVQDSFVVEGGAFYYQISGLEQVGDGYTVVPMIGTARYNLHFGDTFVFFVYGGMTRNYVRIDSELSTEETALLLATPIPAAGAGFFFRVGPNWDARVDLGMEVASLGLTLRF